MLRTVIPKHFLDQNISGEDFLQDQNLISNNLFESPTVSLPFVAELITYVPGGLQSMIMKIRFCLNLILLYKAAIIIYSFDI